MTRLLEIKEWLRGIYSKHNIYIVPALKFILALISFIAINNSLGYMEKLKNPIIVIILALLCSFLPSSMTVVISAVLLAAHFYAVSIETAIIGVMLIILMLLLYFRFNTKDSYVVILTPLAYIFHIPVLSPMVVGLVGNPVSSIAVGCGVIIYYFVTFIKDKAAYISNQSTADMLEKINYIINNMIKNKAMMMTLVSFTAVVLIMYLIRRLSKDYSWFLAIGAGALTNVLIVLIGDFFLDVPNSVIGLFMGTLVASGMALALQFFIFSVDYSRTEYVQFEDDEYYYYVKAVPKLSIAKPNFRVQKINAQKREQRYQKTQMDSHLRKLQREFEDDNEVLGNISENEVEEISQDSTLHSTKN